MNMSPREMMDKIRNKAKLDNLDYGSIIAVKLNKPGRIKMQLLALNPEDLFKSRTQHFIQTLPGETDPNEKIIVVDCQGKDCPVCQAAAAFRASGIDDEMLNAAYKPKYPYRSAYQFLTQPEHYILCAKILLDGAEEGKYLLKDMKENEVQYIQFTKTALNSLMGAYEDFLEDSDEDEDSLPPLFGIFENGAESVTSLTVNCRVATQPFGYSFTFGKAITTTAEEVSMGKLGKLSEGPLVPTEGYMEKALARIKSIQNYFVSDGNDDSSGSISKNDSDGDSLDDILDDIDKL